MQLQDRYRIALLSAYAIAIHGFEALIPTPIPWFRLGLSNIVTLTTLMLYGLRAAMFVTLIRIVISSMFMGTFLGPAFILALGGGILSTLSMGFFFKLLPGLFSPVGLSLIGAFSHNAAQLFFAYLLFVQRLEAILIIAPVLVLLGLITGVINGLISNTLIRNISGKRQHTGVIN